MRSDMYIRSDPDVALQDAEVINADVVADRATDRVERAFPADLKIATNFCEAQLH
jgi:hypothetical protein